MTQEIQSQQPSIEAPDASCDKINIYEINAYQALVRFERFVEGSANDLLLVISSAGLPDQSRQAIESTAERLGLGGSRISWATILGRETADKADDENEPVPISAPNLHLLVESIDPAAIIVTDIGAMSILSEAYGTGLEADSSNRVACRTCATFSDFDTMLVDPDSKQKAWRVLKNLSLEL